MSGRGDGKQQPQPSPYGGPRPVDARRHGIGSPEGISHVELTDVGASTAEVSQSQQPQQSAAAAASPPPTSPPSAATPVSPTADVAAAQASSTPTTTSKDDNEDTPSKPRKRRLFFTPSPRKTPSPSSQQQSATSSYATPQPASRSQSRPSGVRTGGSSTTARHSSGKQQRQGGRRRPPTATPQTGLSGLSTTPRSTRQQRPRSFNPLNRISDIFSPQSPSFSRTSPGLTPIAQDASSESGDVSSASSDSSASSVKEPFTEQVERLNQLLTTPAQQLGDLGRTSLDGEEGDDNLDSEMEDLELSRRKLAMELSQVEFSFLGGTLPQTPEDEEANTGKSQPKSDKAESEDDWVPLLPNVDSSEPNFSPAGESLQPSLEATPSPQSKSASSSAKKKRSPPKAAAASPSPAKASKSSVGKPGLFGRFYSSLNTPPREKKEAKKKAKSPDSTATKEDEDKKPAALKSPPKQAAKTPDRGTVGEMTTPDRPTSGAATVSPFNPFGLGGSVNEPSPSIDEPSPSLNAMQISTMAVMGESPDNESVGASAASETTGGISSLGMGSVSHGTADTGNVFQSIASFGQRLGDQGVIAGNQPVPGLLGEHQQQPAGGNDNRILEELDSILTPPRLDPDEDVRQSVPSVTPGDKTPYMARTEGTPVTPDSEASDTPGQQFVPSLLDAAASAQPDRRRGNDFVTPQKTPAPRSFGQDPYVTPPQDRTQLPSLVDAATSVKMERKGGNDDKPAPRATSPHTWGSLMQFSSEKPASRTAGTLQEDSPYPFANPPAAQSSESGTMPSQGAQDEKETVTGTTLFPVTRGQASSIGRFPSDEIPDDNFNSRQQSPNIASGTTANASGSRTGRPPRTPAQSPGRSLHRHPTDEIDIDKNRADKDAVSSRKPLSVVPILAEDSDDEIIFDTDTPYHARDSPAKSKSPSKSDKKSPASAQSSPMSQDTDGTPGTVPAISSGDTDDKKSPIMRRHERKSKTCQNMMIACLVIFFIVGVAILIGYLTRQDIEETLAPTVSSSPTTTPYPTISPSISPSALPTAFTSDSPTPLGTQSFTTTYEIFIQNGQAAPVPENEYVPSLIGAMDILTGEVLANIENGGATVFWQGNVRRRKLVGVLLPTDILEIRNTPCAVGTADDLCQIAIAEISLVDAGLSIGLFKATTELAIEIGRLQYHLNQVDPDSPAEVIDSQWELPAPTPFAPPTEPPSAAPSGLASSAPSHMPSSTPSILSTLPPVKSPTVLPTASPTQFVLFDFLVRNSFDRGDALNNPWSPQSKAYGWLSQDLQQRDYSPERILQRYAMATVFYATQGENWLSKDLWLTPVSECLWYNEVGDRSPCNSQDELVNLELDVNNLGGSLPPELGLLSNSLERLTMRGGPRRFLSRSLPSELGFLTNLKVFFVRGNRMSGIVPPEIGNWKGLRQLDLSRNRFEGPLPSEIGNFKELYFFEASANSLSGILPTELGLMTKCEFLLFEDNVLFTPIPTEIGNLKVLKEMKGGSNVLLSLPTEIGLLTSANTISLKGASMPGPIPTEIGNLQRLRLLELKNNVFSGRIPTEMGNLFALRDQLDLSRNRLEGPIPSELGMLVELRGLKLQHNLLTGQLPSQISQLIKVTSVQLEGNELRGTIPTEVCTTFNNTYPSFQADCGDFDDNCPCCTSCCADGGIDCVCRYLDTPREFLCFQQKAISP